MNLQKPYIVEVTDKKIITPYCFLSTVKENKKYFTRNEIEGADRARDLQQHLDWPPDQYIIDQLQHNQITNCPVTPDDVKRATEIYGKAIPILKGKMVRKTPKHIETKERVPIHPEIFKLHPNLSIHLDFCFINGNPYLTTITGKIDYRTIKKFKGRGKVKS